MYEGNGGINGISAIKEGDFRGYQGLNEISEGLRDTESWKQHTQNINFKKLI